MWRGAELDATVKEWFIYTGSAVQSFAEPKPTNVSRKWVAYIAG